MFKYSQFDFDIKKSKKAKIIIFLSIILIIITLLVININIANTKDDIKIISSNSRRIINDLNNYTETMSDYLISNINYINIDEKQLEELQKIRISIEYLKELKEQELKEQQLKEQELKEQQLKEQQLKEQQLKEQQLKEQQLKEQQLKEQQLKEQELIKEKAINLIKSYIPNYNELIQLIPNHSSDYVNNECLKSIIEINNEELFNRLINIDYENLTVSFNYFDKNPTDIKETQLYDNYDINNKYHYYRHNIYYNYKENIIKNPIYQIVKQKLEIEENIKIQNYYNDYYKYSNNSDYYYTTIDDIINNHPRYGDLYGSYDSYDFNYNYTNNIKYKYYKNLYFHKYNYLWSGFSYTEFSLNYGFNIINPNSYDSFNKQIYKNICNIPSHFNINKKPIINREIGNTQDIYINLNYKYNDAMAISVNKLKDILNNLEIYECVSGYCYLTNNRGYYIGNGDYYKGTRFFEHNFTNNLPPLFKGPIITTNVQLCTSNDTDCIIGRINIRCFHYTDKINIIFPKITIYDEFEYILVLIKDIANIYDLPIIPPINFI